MHHRYLKTALILSAVIFCDTAALAVVSPSSAIKTPAPRPDVAGITGNISQLPGKFNLISDNDSEFAAWQVFRYQHSGFAALAVGPPVPITGYPTNESELVQIVTDLFHQFEHETGIQNCNPAVNYLRTGKKLTVVSIQPQVDAIDVFGAYFTIILNNRGELISIKSRGFGGQRSGSFSLNEVDAVMTARVVTGIPRGDATVERFWLPVTGSSGIELKPVFAVSLEDENPENRPILYLDAQTGDLLAAENAVMYDRLYGSIRGAYLPLYGRDDPEVTTFPFEWVRVNNQQGYTTSDGDFDFDVNPDDAPFRIQSQLRGPWVDVDYEDGPDAEFRLNSDAPGEVNFTWTNQNSRIDERGLFCHTNFIHDYWKRLDPDFDGLDYPVPATCMAGTHFDNAYWNGHGMFFGDGSEMDNFALYADIIYHEYGHGVTSNMYERHQLPYENESGALNEAWSDYFPCSITNEPLIGEGGLRGIAPLRNLDPPVDLVYPRDIRGEVHLDSRIISAAMWHTREILGSEFCDSLFHYARYLQGTDFLTYFTDVLITDDDDGDITNGTPHYRTLYEQFGRHGIGPGVVPELQIANISIFDDDGDGADGDDDGLWEAGEIVRIEVELYRDDALYPPEAENVSVVISCDHPDIDLISAIAHYGDMEAGESRIGDVPFLFEIDDAAGLSFAGFALLITANDGDFQRLDSLVIPLGHPEIMLVKDDGDARDDMTPYFTSSLNRLGMVYDKYSVDEEIRPLGDRLDLFETVIWYTGSGREGMLERESVQALEGFLEDGKNLLLTGQSAASVENAAPFIRDYLGAVSVVDSVSYRELRGIDGDPVSDGMWLLLAGSPGALNQREPGSIAAIEPAVEIQKWQTIGGDPAAGVRRSDPGTSAKTVLLSFGLEGVSGRGPTHDRHSALGRILEWFGIAQSAPDYREMPVSFEVYSPYPNPFNSSLKIPFSLAESGRLNLSIFDVNGRMVYAQNSVFPSGGNLVTINAEKFSSGFYFVKLASNGKSQTCRIGLVK